MYRPAQVSHLWSLAVFFVLLYYFSFALCMHYGRCKCFNFFSVDFRLIIYWIFLGFTSRLIYHHSGSWWGWYESSFLSTEWCDLIHSSTKLVTKDIDLNNLSTKLNMTLVRVSPTKTWIFTVPDSFNFFSHAPFISRMLRFCILFTYLCYKLSAPIRFGPSSVSKTQTIKRLSKK